MLARPGYNMTRLTSPRYLTAILAPPMLLLAITTGCDREEPAPPVASAATKASPPASAPAAHPSADGRPRVAFLGDSLTAGYGLEAEKAFPAIIGQLLAQDALPIHVLNAGVSGDTTAGGLRRIDWVLRQ